MAFPNNTKRTAKLNSKHSIPLIGLGIGSSQSSSIPASEIENVVKRALENGCRHFEIAGSLHENEERAMGNAIRDSNVLREEIFLTSTLSTVGGDQERRIEEVLQDSLERLGMDDLDLLLMEGDLDDATDSRSDEIFSETWMSLQKLVDAGKVRSIGVRNFDRKQLERLLGDERCMIPPSINQIPLDHPSFPSSIKLTAFNTSKQIHTMTYLPFSSPSERNNSTAPLHNNPTLLSIAKDKGKSVQQILLRWVLHRGWSVMIPPEVGDDMTLEEEEEEEEEKKKKKMEGDYFASELDGWGLTIDEVRAIEGLYEREGGVRGVKV